MINCSTCSKFDGQKCEYFGRLSSMQVCHYAEVKPRNNYEELKAMSMEEMAEWLATVPMSHEYICPYPRPSNCNGGSVENCTKCWLDWLKEEI